MNIQESIKKRVYEKVVNEIDWENQFSDVKKSCIPPDALVKDLQAVLDRAALPSNKRGKLPMNKAIVHKNSVPQTEEGEIDVKAFIDDITTFPNKLISQNGKMEKTSKGNAWVVNTGIPALRGIVYDEDGGKFYTVNTCPGAGGCALVCYARQGSYVMFDHTSMNLTRRLNLLMNHPETFEQMIYLELKRICLAKNNKGVKVLMRWNDAGDFFTKKYWEIARSVTEKLLREGHDFMSYAYTKMGDFMGDLSADIVMNFSREANKQQLSKVDLDNTKASTIVPRDLFRDLFTSTGGGHFKKASDGKPEFNDATGREELKKRLAKEYKVPLSSVIYQEDLPSEEQAPNTFNVIVLPSGDSDEAAQREDVMLIFLLIH